MSETPIDPLQTLDAQLWAKEFMRIWAGRWAEVDEALMIGWFANAIMRGFDEASNRASAQLREKTEEIEQWRQVCKAEVVSVTGAEIEKLRAEVKTLREALTRLRDCDWTISLTDRMDAVRDIARCALSESERSL